MKIKKIYKFLTRNQRSITNKKANYNHINLEWWDEKINIGDYLSKVVYQWMVMNGNCDINKKTRKTIHFLAIGSLIGLSNYDATIWGSGIHCIGSIKNVLKHNRFVKYDIRAVRGPITKAILNSSGYDTNKCVCGDPAILMPMIYKGDLCNKKKYKYSLIRHHSVEPSRVPNNCNPISIHTNDYKYFIDEIISSECVISSSLHGIIIAESYGIPAIFLNDNLENELIKFYDWYFSTGRMTVKIAKTVEEALKITPMEVPNLKKMQNNLIESFPYDLWK